MLLNPRVLVILSELPSEDAAFAMVMEAVSCAARPFGLRFALPEAFRSVFAEHPEEALKREELYFYDENGGLAAASAAARDETHFLSLRGCWAFAEKWDRVLLSRFGRIAAERPLLTACISGAEEQAQAYLPAFLPDFTDAGVRIGEGLPLVCSAAPVRTMVVNPAFLFGSRDLPGELETAPATLSIAAHIAGCTPFALDQAPLWPIGRKRIRRLSAPAPDALPRANLQRFEQLSGLSFERRSMSVRTLNGLFSADDGYPQLLPRRLMAMQRVRSLLPVQTERMPLMVSAFVDLPEALHPAAQYMLRFSALRALQSLPLTLYTGGSQERALRACFPNSLAYPENSLLPKALLAEGMSPMQLFKRNKLLLLRRTLRVFPGYSHAAWVDFDVLPHPICETASPDYTPLMDDRVHIAIVNGEPDTSFIVVPRHCLKLLVSKVQAFTQFDSAMKRSFSEHSLLHRLMNELPDLFTLHPMPEKGLLFLTGFDAALLSKPLAALLSRLPPPQSTDLIEKENEPHE